MEVAPGIWLDARGAVFLAATGTLAVADLHLGYAWAHRQRGNLLPLASHRAAVPRLREIVADYAPQEIALLGDIVHAATATEGLEAELRDLATLADIAPLRLVAGNHDTDLPSLLRRLDLPLAVTRELTAGPHLLLHGDEPDVLRASARLQAAREREGRVILGHEHPAITLSDGFASSARCPCFLVGRDVIVLPAFSAWSVGADIRGGPFLSPYTRAATFERAVAIVAGKLMPVSW